MDIARKEAMFDGFYAVCTNLKGLIRQILAINRQRWEIEESFTAYPRPFPHLLYCLAALRDCEFSHLDGHSFIAVFTPDCLFYALQESSALRLDTQLVSYKYLKSIKKLSADLILCIF